MSASKCSLLVVDDDPAVLALLTRLASSEFDVLAAASAEASQQLFGRRQIDLILADQNLPGMPGVQLLEWVRQRSPRTVRLLMTGLAKFEDAVQAINHGQVYRYLFKPWRPEEMLDVLRDASRTATLERSHSRLLEELRRLNAELEQRVYQRTLELEEANHKLQQQNLMLQRLALTDALTSLPNRRAIEQLVRSELRRRARYPTPLAVALVDVDNFKDINSRCLLPGGDQVLVSLSRTLMTSLRTVDTIGRIGGDEFMVVAPETDADGASALAERIRSAVEAGRYQYKEAVIRVTVSVGFGVAAATQGADYDQLRHAAAAALQEAKSQGRNRCSVQTAWGRPADAARALPAEPADAPI